MYIWYTHCIHIYVQSVNIYISTVRSKSTNILFHQTFTQFLLHVYAVLLISAWCSINTLHSPCRLWLLSWVLCDTLQPASGLVTVNYHYVCNASISSVKFDNPCYISTKEVSWCKFVLFAINTKIFDDKIFTIHGIYSLHDYDRCIRLLCIGPAIKSTITASCMKCSLYELESMLADQRVT